MGIGLIQQNRQDQHLQRKIYIVEADAFIGPKPYALYNVLAFRVDLGIDPYVMAVLTVS